jgi:HK97 family phage prohead protease
MKLEYRASKGLTIREAAPDKGIIGTLIGYAAVFNSNSVRFGGYEKDWIERIAPGAFKRSLTEQSDVVALWSHDASKPTARTPNTLRLSEDERGLAVEIDLIDTATNRDLLANIRAGIVDAMSFGFVPVKAKWEERKDEDADIRTLLDVDLHEVSAVVWPAYPDTTLAARSQRQFRELRASAPDLTEVMQERENFLRTQGKDLEAIQTQNRAHRARLFCR